MSFGDFLGGALQGIGAGIATKGKMDMDAAAAAAKEEAMSKREMMLAQMNTTNKREEQKQASDLRMEETRYEWDRKDAASANADARALKAELAKLGVQFANAAKLETLKGQQERLTAGAKAALDGNEVVGTKTAEDGSVMLYTRSGKFIKAGFKERPTGAAAAAAADPDNPFATPGAKPPANRPPLSSFGN